MKFLITLFLGTTILFSSVDINHATAKEFASLNGIGAKKAEAIIKYRTSVKCFKSIDELTKVKGIGKATISKNKDNLTLGKCKLTD
ncbi:MAG: helix-hairpin-helix domain-containing protein [Campylobacterales bacterium]